MGPVDQTPNKLSSIIPEEELDLRGLDRSPHLIGLQSNKMSAIGFNGDDYNHVKESPFWNNDNAFEFQHALE